MPCPKISSQQLGHAKVCVRHYSRICKFFSHAQALQQPASASNQHSLRAVQLIQHADSRSAAASLIANKMIDLHGRQADKSPRKCLAPQLGAPPFWLKACIHHLCYSCTTSVQIWWTHPYIFDLVIISHQYASMLKQAACNIRRPLWCAISEFCCRM